jgi:hypothetical protein
MKRFSAFGLLSLLFLVVTMHSCGEEQRHGKKPLPPTLFVFEVENVDSVYYHGDLKYEIRAALEQDSIQFRDSVFIPGFGRYLKRRDTLIARHYPQGLMLKMYSDSLKDTLILQARKAVFSNEREIFEFTGDVRITFGKGAICTEQLTFAAISESYKTAGKIRLITPETEINGEGFEADETFTKYKISNIKGFQTLSSK